MFLHTDLVIVLCGELSKPIAVEFVFEEIHSELEISNVPYLVSSSIGRRELTIPNRHCLVFLSPNLECLPIRRSDDDHP